MFHTAHCADTDTVQVMGHSAIFLVLPAESALSVMVRHEQQGRTSSRKQFLEFLDVMGSYRRLRITRAFSSAAGGI